MLGEQPPANLGPGEEERLGLLRGTGSLAQGSSSWEKPSRHGPAHPTPHPPSLARAMCRSSGAKNRAKPALPAGIFLPPYICRLSLKRLSRRTARSGCLGAEEGEIPRDPFEMVPWHLSSQGEGRSSGHSGAGLRLVTIHHTGIPPGAPGCSHQAPLAARAPKRMVSSFLTLIKGRGKSEWERKEERRCLSGRVFPSTGGRDWSQAGVLLLQLPDQAGRTACTNHPVPWDRTGLPRGKKNQANKAVSSSGMSPSPGSTEAAE